MIDSDDLIKHATDEEYQEYSQKIENLHDDVLVEAARYLGANVPEGATWQDYRDTFAEYSWKDATRALEHAAGGTDYSNL